MFTKLLIILARISVLSTYITIIIKKEINIRIYNNIILNAANIIILSTARRTGTRSTTVAVALCVCVRLCDDTPPPDSLCVRARVHTACAHRRNERRPAVVVVGMERTGLRRPIVEGDAVRETYPRRRDRSTTWPPPPPLRSPCPIHCRRAPFT